MFSCGHFFRTSRGTQGDVMSGNFKFGCMGAKKVVTKAKKMSRIYACGYWDGSRTLRPLLPYRPYTLLPHRP